jgi:hypothetical protein
VVPRPLLQHGRVLPSRFGEFHLRRPAQVRRGDLATGSVDFSKIADGTVGRAELSGKSVDAAVTMSVGRVSVGVVAVPQ